MQEGQLEKFSAFPPEKQFPGIAEEGKEKREKRRGHRLSGRLQSVQAGYSAGSDCTREWIFVLSSCNKGFAT